MCAIVGAVLSINSRVDSNEANRIVNHLFKESLERGRDGVGYTVLEQIDDRVYDYSERRPYRHSSWISNLFFTRLQDQFMPAKALLLANMRAEPTTEYVKEKRECDQQPYRIGSWSIVHNGTIANDAALRTGAHPTSIDSAAISETLDRLSDCGVAVAFRETIKALKGSYAILAAHDSRPDTMFVAANYRPVWYARDESGTYFASSRDYFLPHLTPTMLEPYSVWAFTATDRVRLDAPITKRHKRALVVCSGGMDSVVSAQWADSNGYSIELLHFRYGSRAEGPEVEAIQAIAQHMSVPLHFMPMGIYDPEDSPLLQKDSAIAGGEAGAEFAHEWVPARNLVMLALATAYAEAKGFDTIVLGNNLEEAGAYPDNEPEFIARFNDLLPFAVGDGKKLEIIMPVGNMMKHEIVALGEQLGAPMHLTWSCYRAGEHHCGKCGPCFMRKTAYAINGIVDPLTYQEH